MRLFAPVILLGVLLSGCGDLTADRGSSAEPDEEWTFKRAPTVALQFYDESETGLAYAAAETSAEARIFLVAGSIRGANFAQEVVEQRRLWLARGATEDQIACYYVLPDKTNFDDDAAQYRALADELRTCKLANVKAIADDMARAATTSPEHVYLYVTSHGDRPLSYYATHDDSDEGKMYGAIAKAYPYLDHYMLAVDSTPSGSANIGMQIDAVEAGTQPADIFLTPARLNAALAVFAPEIDKTVVLQGCYSGGFVAAPDAKPEDLLGATPRITVLTAASHERPSFGCGVADKTTFFGGAVLTSLATTAPVLPWELDWLGIYDATKAKVATLEAELEYKASEPAYYTNR